jgi:hypothetical protein
MKDNLTINQKLVKSALVDKLGRQGLSLENQETICNLIKQIEIGTNLLTIPSE